MSEKKNRVVAKMLTNGRYERVYEIVSVEEGMTPDEICEEVCSCGLVFGYTLNGNILRVNVD